ncbi:MAG: STAS domain-containing protein [Planctomycetes bacterium]|nr:STAS domain-containing protein [Planctomycetota bacterium]
MLKRITERIRKAWAETAPAYTGAPTRLNPCTHLAGRLSLTNAAYLRKQLWRLLWQRSRVVALDCSKVRFMDGSALAVMIEFADACKDAGTTLRLLEPSNNVMNAFSMYGLDEVLTSLAEFNELEVDGLLIVLEEDFLDSIRLPALVIEEEELAESLRLPVIDANDYKDAA